MSGTGRRFQAGRALQRCTSSGEFATERQPAYPALGTQFYLPFLFFILICCMSWWRLFHALLRRDANSTRWRLVNSLRGRARPITGRSGVTRAAPHIREPGDEGCLPRPNRGVTTGSPTITSASRPVRSPVSTLTRRARGNDSPSASRISTMPSPLGAGATPSCRGEGPSHIAGSQYICL